MEQNPIVAGPTQSELLVVSELLTANEKEWPLIFHSYHESGQGGLLTFRFTSISLIEQVKNTNTWEIQGEVEILGNPLRNGGVAIAVDYNAEKQKGFMHFKDDE